MEPDLPGMRAFVTAAEELHFGRAAARLFLTQQALSKRIRKLEEALGVQLFARTTRTVALTPAGRRFLDPARDALVAYDAAVAAGRGAVEPLRIDVYAERFTPLRVLRETLERLPGTHVELSMRNGLALALPAVESRELDAAFGRARDIGRPWPPELAHRPVRLEPIHAAVFTDHDFAGRSMLRIAEIREAGIAMPDPGGSEEWRGYLTRLAEELRVPVRFTEPAVGARGYGERIRQERHAIGVSEAGTDLPFDPDLRLVPLVDPTPLHLWSVVWRRDNTSPQLRALLKALPFPVPPDPADADVWLPGPDRKSLSR
ncbi:LysR family transcriptional regulator [Streptomyces sp. NPDC048172]|uniref:LysR family transcriptional regulator n=1 Tax=Streptomyces sp. NPDC048172 TaxID=3365505 RepID=UPI003718E6A8